MENLLYKKMIFDDYTKSENGEVWSQICKECVNDNVIDASELDDAGQGICGIKNCMKESSFYIDFDKTKIQYDKS